jgi:hypothetical protein
VAGADNLKPFKEGFDPRRNLDGRPPILPDIAEAVAKVLADEKDGKSALEAVFMALRSKAVKGDVRAAQELLDRAYGKAKMSVDHTNNGKEFQATTVIIQSTGEAPEKT